MKTLSIMLAAGAFALCGLAGAQSAVPDNSSPSARAPAKPGAGTPPDSSKKAPSSSGGSGESGAVVTPPATGTEDMVKKPKNVDPAMGGATGRIDREKQEEIEGKTEGSAKGKPEYK